MLIINDSDFVLKCCCVQGYLHKRLHFEKFTFEARQMEQIGPVWWTEMFAEQLYRERFEWHLKNTEILTTYFSWFPRCSTSASHFTEHWRAAPGGHQLYALKIFTSLINHITSNYISWSFALFSLGNSFSSIMFPISRSWNSINCSPVNGSIGKLSFHFLNVCLIQFSRSIQSSWTRCLKSLKSLIPYIACLDYSESLPLYQYAPLMYLNTVSKTFHRESRHCSPQEYSAMNFFLSHDFEKPLHHW